ncbi:hypothetical protein SK355_03640 [Candidatus Fukatsuia symbiotica]|uniref:Uncharacterized protein n=1 Tax=Candidatus Fukatsuia symbiotica TaxID=1878942 RepID=A0A2U8I321_9GAMM|nr:hypothetical protein [Candidatus Fukatsuia symbiotica]AWK13510.1 hypothetical protein CCS41_01745 [Candidatus Fukatsuia symbiotica]MEA9444414.1 hypothetical protein [Candidatus Fukatsuia symbiotica]
MIKQDALLWWQKRGRDTSETWAIRVAPVTTAVVGSVPIEIQREQKKIIARHSDQRVYLSDKGIKPLETIRLAALTLQKLFTQPFYQ